MTPRPVTLRPMRPNEVDRHNTERDERYVAALTGVLPAAQAREHARRARQRFLPNGLMTPRHHLVVAETTDGTAVGSAWVGLDDPQSGATGSAWLYDLQVDPTFRRRGFGAAILRAVEDLVRAAGAHRLGLNVFGDNTGAIALYSATGYTVTSQQMARDLGLG